METTFGTSAFSPVTTVTRGEKNKVIVKISKFSGKRLFFPELKNIIKSCLREEMVLLFNAVVSIKS